MARLVTSGLEILDHPTTDIGHPDGFAAGATLCVSDLSIFRSGKAACRCDGTAANNSFRTWPFTVPTLGTAIFDRVYLRFGALPASTVKVSSFTTAASGAIVSVRLTSTGKLQLWNDVAGTQIGSDSTLTVELDRFYRIQSSLVLASGATDSIELRAKVDDYQAIEETVATASGLDLGDTHAGRSSYGWIDAPGATASAWIDDVAINDTNTGAGQQSWPTDGKQVWLAPKAVGGTGVGSWTDCSGAATPWLGLDNLPPIGLADHVTAGHTGASVHQARVTPNTAQGCAVKTTTLAGAGVMHPAGLMQGTSAGSTSAGIGTSATVQKRAQSFMFGADPGFDSVALRLAKTGSPTDSVWLEVQSDSGGAPSGTVLASSALLAATSVTSAIATYIFGLDQVVTIVPGVTYWLVLQRSGAFSASAFVAWAKDITAADTYTDGEPALFNGTSWMKTGTGMTIADHNFRIMPLQGMWPPLVTVPSVCHGQAVTGAKTGNITHLIGAVGATNKAFTYGNNVGVAGTYSASGGNWRWSQGNPTYKPAYSLDNQPTVQFTKDATSGTPACLACAAGIYVEYWLPPAGWSRLQKTADSTFWWAKRVIADTDLQKADATVLTVNGGDWAIYPDPQIGDEDYPATLTSITDATLQAGYTPA